MRALVPLSVALATALRLWILAAGPDTDTDAYGHAMAGRWMLLDPPDVRVHWVWLPLWHAVQAAIAALGGGLSEARALNVALSAAPPFLLARLLRGAGDEALAALAGALLALWPLALGLGQSGQPEPLFLLLTLGAAVAWHEQRPTLAGALLAAAALCRYEAWVLPPVYLALWWHARRHEDPPVPPFRGEEPWVHQQSAPPPYPPPRRGGRGGPLVWLLPGLAIVGWSLVHWRGTGEFLQFLRANRQFALDASRRMGFPWGPEPRPLRMALWYPLLLPASYLRVFSPFALLGAGAAWRRRLPGALLWPSLGVLVFLSYGWVMRLNLGLPRHMLVLAPLQATLTALGLVTAARWLGERWLRRWPLVPLSALLFAAARTLPMAAWERDQHAAALPSPRAAAAALQAAGLGPADRVVCDLPTVEMLGRLPAWRMLRRAASSLTADEARALAASLPPGGRLFVVARPPDTAALRPAARVLHESDDEVVLALDPGGAPGPR